MKKFLALLVFFCLISSLSAEKKAYELVNESTKKGNADESAEFLMSELQKLTVPAEKRAGYAFLGNLQEMLGLYELAEKSYVTAAGIAAADAENMPERSNEQLVLDAVRCALSGGNSSRADSYLNSAVRSSKNAKIQSYVKLYSVWSSLCRAENKEDLEEPVAMLKAYANVSSMKSVQPAILLTLWYITGDSSYANEIKIRFPDTTECAIVKGDSQILPSPFWYFVPKSGEAVAETGTLKDAPKTPKELTVTESSKKSESAGKLQLGLFSSSDNANNLVEELKKKGFNAYFEKQTKASGNVYFTVFVNAKDENTADALRSSGYECYMVN
ncbi:MAG: SPOR domain-containing protein [Treponema sp.]|nr:SPOR domain-containing protein [Treponema sp.]